MWRNYLTVGFRALIKNKTYAFINIFGLAIGLAACLMLLIYVDYERSYDEWLPGSENVYQVHTTWRDTETGEVTPGQMSAYVVGTSLRKDFPQIQSSVYALATQPVVMRGGQALPTEDVVFVDNLFFDVLEFPLVRGDPRTALRQPGSVVLTESEARKYFGDANPMGQTLTLITRGLTIDHRVTGVMRDLPRNSHMRLNMVARFDPASYFGDTPDFLTQWGWQSGWNYVRLRDGAQASSVNSQLPQWEQRNIPDQTFGDQTLNQGDIADWQLVNVRDVHLAEAQGGGSMSAGNDERTILTFTIVAFLILGMACINFTNLATARASQRAREVALRKVLGANRRQLMAQFLAESVLVSGLAMLLALALVELLLPMLASFLDASFEMTYFGSGSMLLPILLLTLIVGAAGGVYPALYLSRFQPAQVLKANKSTSEAAGSGKLRSALVIGQFAVSIGLIICTAVVYAQTIHARTADPGFRREGILQIDELGRRQLVGREEAIAREIERVPGVQSVGLTGIGIATQNQNNTGVFVPGRDQPVGMGNYTIDDGFFRTMGMEFIAGRDLSRNRPMDVDPRAFPPDVEADRALAARGINVVINELGARRLGFTNPADAAGRQFRMGLADEEAGLVPITIVGVVKDTRFRSIREPLEPIVYRLGSGITHLVVRYDTAEPNAVRSRIEQAWRRLVPDVPFNADFSEDIVSELYDAEEARAQVFAGFAFLAIVIACLGLFGLAAFTAERRTKEIGIRKVLGARTRDIVRLLAWQFSKPIIIANLIAWPIAWWVMRDWLNTFDARIDLGPTPFFMAGLLALAIAIGTIAGHALRVARANPIHALRYE